MWPLTYLHTEGKNGSRLHQEVMLHLPSIPPSPSLSPFLRYNSDNPLVEGDVGMAGVAVDSVEDMKVDSYHYTIADTLYSTITHSYYEHASIHVLHVLLE